MKQVAEGIGIPTASHGRSEVVSKILADHHGTEGGTGQQYIEPVASPHYDPPFLAGAGTRILLAHSPLYFIASVMPPITMFGHSLLYVVIHPCPLRRKMLRIPECRKLVHLQTLPANRPVKTLNICILLRIARLGVLQFKPRAAAHSCTLRLINSGPLSKRNGLRLAPPCNQPFQSLHNIYLQ